MSAKPGVVPQRQPVFGEQVAAVGGRRQVGAGGRDDQIRDGQRRRDQSREYPRRPVRTEGPRTLGGGEIDRAQRGSLANVRRRIALVLRLPVSLQETHDTVDDVHSIKPAPVACVGQLHQFAALEGVGVPLAEERWDVGVVLAPEDQRWPARPG